jgi:phosphoglycerate dehydrogenase-like enzyme
MTRHLSNPSLQKHTRHIISTTEFEKMKDGVVIVNTARGAVMDEDALVRALDSGKVWSCGLDVYEEEPKIHPGLLSNPHVMLVPHMGTWTIEVGRYFNAFSHMFGFHCTVLTSINRHKQPWRSAASATCVPRSR